MNNELLAELVLFKKAEDWLKRNPERLNNQEKVRFKAELMQYLHGGTPYITDEVFYFLNSLNLTKSMESNKEFAQYLKAKYPDLSFFTILDVGAGRMCHLSTELAKMNASVVAMDPNIRLTPAEARANKIKAIKKELFMCDKYAKNSAGTNIHVYDLLVGMEPCMAIEHIIRQGQTI